MLYREGSSGDPIRDIQRRLAALGETISDQERARRSYGATTAEAVRCFQQRRGLAADGLVGPETWRELVEASWRLGDRIIYLRSPQMRGDDVREVQERLSKLGFDSGRIDGIFGPQTVRALVEFQRNFGLPVDEIVGPLTLRALRGMPSFGGDTPVTRLREHETLRRMPATLSGLTIVLDPGHGPQAPGHASVRGTNEEQVAFALTRRLESTLAAAGTEVFLTRNAFTTPTDSDRASLANTLVADLYIAIHMAAADDPGASGASTYYFGNDSWHSMIGKELAEHVQDKLSQLGLVDGRAHAKTWGVLRETRMPAIQIECGYMTNRDDEEKLIDPAFQLKVAEAIFVALRTLAHAA